MPSVLRIAMFFLIFHLMIIVVNHIEIAPGYSLNTGQIEPFATKYDPLNGIYLATTNAQKSISALGNISSTGGDIVLPACVATGVFNFCYDLRQNPTAKFDLLGASIPYGPPLLLLDIAIAGAFALGSIVVSFGLEILLLIIVVTIGAIPFWITLFSFIDPVFGILLGVIIGLIQMIYIGIGIFKFVSAMIAGVSRFL